MRKALILAACLIAPQGLAAQGKAQGWQVYRFEDAGFAVQLPAQPTTTKGEWAGGPSTTYALSQPDIVYSVTVADLTRAPARQQAAVAEAVKALGATGEIKLDVQERIDRQFGRQLTIAGKDGGRSMVSVFLVNGKLYQLEGKALPPDPGSGSGKALRFQQSLEFIGLGAEANRPENRGPGVAGGPGGRGAPPGGPGGRRQPPPQALAACRGKSVGAAVRHTLPRGDTVDATCIQTPQGLAARPNGPLPGPLGLRGPPG